MIEQLRDYVHDPQNARANFSLALAYEDQGHLAAASGFYVRAAVHASDTLLSYEALLRLANCFTKLGGRVYMCKGLLLRAISLFPNRPEAYFLLSRLYEWEKEWQEAYTFAVMGQQFDDGQRILRTNVDYPGKYALVFEQAVSSWWIGLYDESLQLFRSLSRNHAMLPIHLEAVRKNLKNLEGEDWNDSLAYQASMYDRMQIESKSLVQ